MGLWEAIILGIVQGATEYLPVSSSGHLVLVPWALGFEKAPFAFDVLVQMGTLVGVLVYYRVRLWRVTVDVVDGLTKRRPMATPESRFGWYVVIATFPAAGVGLAFKDVFEQTFASPKAAMGFLYFTAALLVVAEVFSPKDDEGNPGKRSDRELNLLDAVVIGVFQALALFPGVSRSGSTIAAGMLRGLDRESATNFSFVMSVPVMLGAGVIATKDLVADPAHLAEHGAGIAIGTAVAAITGYAVIVFFLRFVKGRGLLPFAAYCATVATLGLIFV